MKSALPELTLLEALADLASLAGAAIMAQRGCTHRGKADGSPVTEADTAAEAIILGGLQQLLPGVPVVAEEAASAGTLPGLARQFLLVDPLDGTREFIAGRSEFTVNIALIDDGAPVAGVIYAPALSRLWLAGAHAEALDLAPGVPVAGGEGRRPVEVRRVPEGDLVAAASLHHNSPNAEAFLKRLPVRRRTNAGSSLKFCLIAQGAADIYPRFSPTMEWDTAAGDAILRAAGGAVVTPDGQPLRYGKQEAGYRNGDFVAIGDPALLAHLPLAELPLAEAAIADPHIADTPLANPPLANPSPGDR